MVRKERCKRLFLYNFFSAIFQNISNDSDALGSIDALACLPALPMNSGGWGSVNTILSPLTHSFDTVLQRACSVCEVAKEHHDSRPVMRPGRFEVCWSVEGFWTPEYNRSDCWSSWVRPGCTSSLRLPHECGPSCEATRKGSLRSYMYVGCARCSF